MLIHQPLMDPPRGMPLLARRIPIRQQPPIDHRPIPTELRRPTTHRRPLRRRHRRHKRLPDRPAVDPVPPRQRPDRQPLPRVIAPDQLELLHSPQLLPAFRIALNRAPSVRLSSDGGGASSDHHSGASSDHRSQLSTQHARQGHPHRDCAASWQACRAGLRVEPCAQPTLTRFVAIGMARFAPATIVITGVRTRFRVRTRLSAHTPGGPPMRGNEESRPRGGDRGLLQIYHWRRAGHSVRRGAVTCFRLSARIGSRICRGAASGAPGDASRPGRRMRPRRGIPSGRILRDAASPGSLGNRS